MICCGHATDYADAIVIIINFRLGIAMNLFHSSFHFDTFVIMFDDLSRLEVSSQRGT